MFELSVKTHFSAAHHLPGYDGQCVNPHGHNWVVEVFISGPTLDRLGFLADFREIKVGLKAVLSDLDHRDLNTLPDFQGKNPTSENLARYVFRALAANLKSRRFRVSRVTVSETPGTLASYWEEDRPGRSRRRK
jgi:6-pyruvoyltetrahydropterin/6-carboxytetrahydropterin synthase